jgi:AraC-like DNA-binding protein
MEAKRIWLDNIQDPLSLAALSKKTGLNTQKLKIGFKKLFGHSPYDLLLNTRMEMAERLLSETNLSISAIADSVGYTGIQSFSKAFKLFFKMSPLQYRKILPPIDN